MSFPPQIPEPKMPEGIRLRPEEYPAGAIGMLAVKVDINFHRELVQIEASVSEKELDYVYLTGPNKGKKYRGKLFVTCLNVYPPERKAELVDYIMNCNCLLAWSPTVL